MSNFSNYSIVPDLNDEDYPSSKSDSSDQEDDAITKISKHMVIKTISSVNKSSDEDDEIGDGLRTTTAVAATTITQPASIIPSHAAYLERTSSLPFILGQVERRRRKLPEIPKNKKCKCFHGPRIVRRIIYIIFSFPSNSIWPNVAGRRTRSAPPWDQRQ